MAIYERMMRDLTKSQEGVEIVFGKPDLTKAIGMDAVAEAIASTRFPGSSRAIPRGTWHPYVFEREGRWFVAAPTEAEIVKSKFTLMPSAEAAVSHYRRLLDGERPRTPDTVAVSPSDWTLEDGVVLALDTEGDCERVSLATPTQAASWQWSEPVRQLVQTQIQRSSEVLAYFAHYDHDLLVEHGVDPHTEKWRCLLVAHRLLNPWRLKGLGYAAPLYAMCEPWKAKIDGDEEDYSLKDAWILQEMWPLMQRQLTERRLLDVYGQELALQFAGVTTRSVHQIQGREDPVTRAASILETPLFRQHYQPEGWLSAAPAVDGDRGVAGIRHPYLAAFKFCTGHTVDPEDPVEREALVRWMCGYGIDKSRKGGKGLAPLLDRFPDRRSLEAVREQYPEIHEWLQAVKSLLKRDHYVSNYWGRRWYNGVWQDAARFLLTSTVQDTLKSQIIESGVVPDSFMFGAVLFEDGQRLRSYIREQSGVAPLIENLV